MGQSFEKKSVPGAKEIIWLRSANQNLIMVCMDVPGSIGTVVGVQASGTWKMIKKNSIPGNIRIL